MGLVAGSEVSWGEVGEGVISDWIGELTVRSATVPGAMAPVFGSIPTAPEQ